MKKLKILIILLFIISCKEEKCKQIDSKFRPHKVRHVNKSKIYYYYHNTPCDCRGIDKDLHAPWGHTKRLYVQFYDNGEIIWEK